MDGETEERGQFVMFARTPGRSVERMMIIW
jgi:hypothetical protein